MKEVFTQFFSNVNDVVTWDSSDPPDVTNRQEPFCQSITGVNMPATQLQIAMVREPKGCCVDSLGERSGTVGCRP